MRVVVLLAVLVALVGAYSQTLGEWRVVVVSCMILFHRGHRPCYQLKPNLTPRSMQRHINTVQRQPGSKLVLYGLAAHDRRHRLRLLDEPRAHLRLPDPHRRHRSVCT